MLMYFDRYQKEIIQMYIHNIDLFVDGLYTFCLEFILDQ